MTKKAASWEMGQTDLTTSDTFTFEQAMSKLFCCLDISARYIYSLF